MEPHEKVTSAGDQVALIATLWWDKCGTIMDKSDSPVIYCETVLLIFFVYDYPNLLIIMSEIDTLHA